MSAIEEISVGEYESVLIVQERETGLRSVTAVHDTTLGPALGGLRMIPYPGLEEATADVLKLARAMTYKNSLCGCNLGGGKSVIIAGETEPAEREELLMSYGSFVQGLGGRYITAEDMGTTVEDMSIIMRTCEFVTGRDPAEGGGGDPSSHTARGVFEGMRACLERVFGSDDFNARHIAVQGVGSVGSNLVKLLAEAGARLTVADITEKAVSDAREQYGAHVVGVGDIVSIKCEVFCPCAVGGTVNSNTVDRLNCRILAGAANNQLESERIEEKLFKRGILYAPDFAINAGGVIMCADELEAGGFTLSRVQKRVLNIYNTVGKILDEAAEREERTGKIAIEHAMRRIENAR